MQDRNNNWLGRTTRQAVLGALGLLLWTLPGHAAEPAYTTGPATTLPSSNTGWDYITLDQATGRLFIARRADGLTVWNTKAGKVLATVENSTGANGVVLVPESNRGYTAMTDGTMLAFDLATLKPIERVKLDDGDLNQGFYDPATKRVHMVVGTRPARTTWISLDAATGKVLGRTGFDSKKMDDPAPDGKGTLYAPMRDNNALLKMSSFDLKVQAIWKLGDCVQPVAVEFNHAANRVLVACRGDKPVFLALDPADGRIVATLPIGRGVDGMAHDEGRHLLVTANGVDGTMSVIRQDGPDKYSLVETVATRPMARVIALDAASGRLFIVTAGYTQPAAGPGGKLPPPVFHKDSFTVMSYAWP